MFKDYVKLQRAKRLLRSDQKTLEKRRKEFGEGHIMVELNEAMVALDELRIVTIEKGKNSEEHMQAKGEYEKQRDRLHVKCAWQKALPTNFKNAVRTMDDIVAEEDLI